MTFFIDLQNMCFRLDRNLVLVIKIVKVSYLLLL